jgi:hypothetical protein
MRTCNFLLRSLGVFSCLLGPVIAVYGVEVSGLSIKQNVQGATLVHPDSPVVRLDELLGKYPFLEAHIDEKVEILFSGEDSSSQGSDSELTDTDKESERADDQEAQSGWGRFALNTSPNKNDSKRTYFLQKEDGIGTDPSSFTMNLCSKLAKDALCIANAHKHARTRESTTCLCVVLRDKDKHAKKFVFHNGSDKMNPTMKGKAQELDYAVRTGYQAHAEAEFMQFLLQRIQQNSGRYTHILGMGCSRPHCKECNCLWKLFLGSNYHKFTAAMKKEASDSEVVMPIIKELSQEEGDGIRVTVPEESQVFKVVHEEEAVQDKNYGKYRLSEVLKDHIKLKTNCQSLDFSDERFKIDEGVVQRMEKKRKR